MPPQDKIKNQANIEEQLLCNEVENSDDLKSENTEREKANIAEQLFREESANSKNDFESENQKEKENISESLDITDKIIDNANKYFLVKILSPEITNNESKKREHKDKLIKMVQIFLFFQFVIVMILVLITIIMVFVFHGLKNDIELSYIDAIIKFISVYITSVVVELIAMLNYIVSNVFDTSIAGLVEIYKDKNKNQEQES